MLQESRGRLRMSREFGLEAAIATTDWPTTRDSLLKLLEQLDRAKR
jgi:hypothetical protein